MIPKARGHNFIKINLFTNKKMNDLDVTSPERASQNILNLPKEEINYISEYVQKRLHTNAYEHSHFWIFLRDNLFASLIGILLGGIIDQVLYHLQDITIGFTNRVACATSVVINILIIIAFFFFINSHPFIRRYLFFDDWLLGTFAGFLFGLTFFQTQEVLTQNIQCVIKL